MHIRIAQLVTAFINYNIVITLVVYVCMWKHIIQGCLEVMIPKLSGELPSALVCLYIYSNPLFLKVCLVVV